MLGPTASKWYRASGLLFQLRPHRSFKANTFSTRTAFHGNPILLPKTLTSISVRTTSRLPFHVNAFLSDASSAPSPPDGRSWFSTSPDLRNPTPPVSKGTSVEQITNVKIFRTLASYLWMKDNYEFRIRVIAALGFLVGAKVLNVQVPFLFKLAVDWLSSATGNAAALASFTAANSTQLALFATPVSVLIGYGIARTGASAFNGTTHEVIACSYHSFGYSCFNTMFMYWNSELGSCPFLKFFKIVLCRITDCCVF